ncbi:transcriptional regulator [Levilactobacillus namurensis]|uniref:Transcriptional regulator n=1 Tax=Levilactobacillus namurensis TaxID=380393 RepID=A0AAW8WAJ7_9LACO|nr:transcriptional regulator [Levilactobacillus namurensis]MDT7015403.1 transcriptional regulator [Levilactobacillus namurensis]
MKRSTIRTVEDILRDYPKIDKYIEQREQELRYPVTPVDENVGGGRAQNGFNDSTDRLIITLDEDKRINALKKQRQVIDDCLDEVGEDTEIIIDELYFRKRPRYTIDGLITNGLIHVSRRKAFYLKKQFIHDCAKELGLYDL